MLMDMRYVGKRRNGTLKDHLRDVAENCSQRHAYSLHICNLGKLREDIHAADENHFERDAKSVTM